MSIPRVWQPTDQCPVCGTYWWSNFWPPYRKGGYTDRPEHAGVTCVNLRRGKVLTPWTPREASDAQDR
jgi:hypothetical protein